MSTSDIVAAISPLVDALLGLGVPYGVVGSVASSAHGIARTTLDVDLVADLRMKHVEPLVAAVSDAYYIDRDAVADAVRRRGMFNVVHLDTMLKVDVYLLTDRPFDAESFRRRIAGSLDDGDEAKPFSLGTAEDIVLHKLEWYRHGGEVSERQWGDVLGVLKVQRATLDFAYMRHWATELGISDLLDRALRDAGITND